MPRKQRPRVSPESLSFDDLPIVTARTKEGGVRRTTRNIFFRKNDLGSGVCLLRGRVRGCGRPLHSQVEVSHMIWMYVVEKEDASAVFGCVFVIA